MLFNAFIVGLKEIAANKFRSLLTMLGIILGVSSLIAMSAIVKGMENGMKETLIAMGGLDKALTQTQPVPAWQDHLADMAPGRTLRDVEALMASAPLLRVVCPQISQERALLTRGGKSVSPSELVGCWPNFLDMDLHTVAEGRFFNEIDDEQARNVVVIGTGIRDELFGAPEQVGREINPVGEIVMVNGEPFVVVGMFQHYESETDKRSREQKARQPADPGKSGGVQRARGWGSRGRSGGWAFGRKNYTACIPLNTMWLRFRAAIGTNNTPDTRLTDLDLKVANLDKLEVALQQARNVLMLTHHGVEDFTFQTQENSVDNINQTIRNARMSGGIISAISLLVGGIGIMNIMLASITERIREIGLRKAIGATTFSVFIQILVESGVIAVVGGIAGLGTSWGFVELLGNITPGGNLPVITPGSLATAFCFALIVGVVAGVIPAIKASRLDPIQALRYE